MKRETALKYSVEIARRVHSVNGVLATPLCSSTAVRISRVWVFGSTAKGSQAPNDLDVLIEIKECGQHRNWKQAKLDRRYLRSYGMKQAPSAIQAALQWLTKGMRLVSRHTTRSEASVLDVKTLIYPRYDMPKT